MISRHEDTFDIFRTDLSTTTAFSAAADPARPYTAERGPKPAPPGAPTPTPQRESVPDPLLHVSAM